jgi:hypothetical protein
MTPHPFEDDWLGTFPNPLVPHNVRRRRRIAMAVWIVTGLAVVWATVAAVSWAGPYIGQFAVIMFGE